MTITIDDLIIDGLRNFILGAGIIGFFIAIELWQSATKTEMLKSSLSKEAEIVKQDTQPKTLKVMLWVIWWVFTLCITCIIFN